MGTAVVAGGNASPVLELGNRFSTLWRFLYSLLLEGSLLLLSYFVSNQHACLWKIPQQDLSTGEVAAWPFAEEKADRSSFPVAHHRSLAGEAPFGATHQARFSAPFLRLEAVR